MADQQVVEGALIAATEDTYAPFPDRETGEKRPGGVKYHIWLLVDFESDPQQIRVKDAHDFGAVREAGAGAQVRAMCELRAFDSRIVRTLKQLEIRSKAPPDLASAKRSA